MCAQVLGNMIVYPNRMSFDIMPGGGKPPEPTGMLVVKVKSVTDIHGGGDLFSKVRASSAPFCLFMRQCTVGTDSYILPGANTPF